MVGLHPHGISEQTPGEHAGQSLPTGTGWGDRAKRMEDSLDVIAKIWNGGAVSHDPPDALVRRARRRGGER